MRDTAGAGSRRPGLPMAGSLLTAMAGLKAWEWFAAAPDRIASIMRREWAIAPVPAQTNQND